jgi:UDP-N-acetylmuramate-alanine ligase
MREFGQRDVVYAGTGDAGIQEIVTGVQPGDFILTMGAGSVSQLGEKILENLNSNA